MTVLSETLSPYSLIEEGTAFKRNNWIIPEFIFDFTSTLIRKTDELAAETKDILEKIKSFTRLHENWDGYGAAPPSKVAAQNAYRFVKQLAKLQVPVFFTAPGPDGEILVELQDGDKSVEVTFEPDGSASYAQFLGTDCVSEDAFNDQAIDKLAQWIQNQE